MGRDRRDIRVSKMVMRSCCSSGRCCDRGVGNRIGKLASYMIVRDINRQNRTRRRMGRVCNHVNINHRVEGGGC